MRLDTSEIEYELVEDLKTELSIDDPMFNETILRQKVRNVIRELQFKRNYVASNMSDEKVLEDIWNYYSVIRNVALYDYNQVGVEFQISSSENYDRTYVDRDDLWKGVHAFVGILV